jgi:dynein heavy chain
MFELPSPA